MKHYRGKPEEPRYAGFSVAEIAQPTIDVLTAARRKGYDLGSESVTAMVLANNIQTFASKVPGTTYEALAKVAGKARSGTGDPIIEQQLRVSQRLSADIQYRAEIERKLRELMGE